MKKALLGLLLLLLLSSTLYGEPTNLIAIKTSPSGALPIGSSPDLFSFGGGLDASLAFFPAGLQILGFGLGGNLKVLPLASEDTDEYVRVLSGGFGVHFRLPLGDRFALLIHGSAGYYTWTGVGWDPGDVETASWMAQGGADAVFRLTGPFSLGVGAYFDYYDQLYNGLGFDMTLRLDFPLTAAKESVTAEPVPDAIPQPLTGMDNLQSRNPGNADLSVEGIELKQLFPVLYKYYDENPVGTVVVKNNSSVPAEDVTLSFYVERYMDNPMEMGGGITVNAGDEAQIELFGLFTEELMQITEGTKASAKLSVTYRMDGETKTSDYTPVLQFHNRNALSWDDDRKIASFVTAKDPEILTFGKRVTNWMQEVKNPAIDENLQKGMAMFEALNAFGMQYEIDPTTPFTELSGDATAIDFLQFPRQSLRYTSGDCDDLSALYTSLLEAVGVETAVITIPGHIYTAFALQTPPNEARDAFTRIDEYIVTDDKVWVPVEITLCQHPFEKAWEEGAKEWRENNSRNQAAIYPTRLSWQTYQAVGFTGEAAGIQMPDRDTVIASFKQSLDRHIDRKIYPQVARLRGQIEGSNTPYKYENKLAVVYARHGMYEKAVNLLDEIVTGLEYAPALINLGNIRFLREEYDSALLSFERVLEIDDSNKMALLGVSRCHHELQNYGLVGKTYDKLKSISPDLATRFAYLDLKGDEAGRAASAAGVKKLVLWEEEE